MDAILEKLFRKYFVFKIQEDWKEELKKIPEELLKEWMDDDLFKKIDEHCADLVSSVTGDVEDKWNNELWMDINEFVNDYETKQEEAQAIVDGENDIPEDYWDTDDEDDLKITMYCPDVDENCNCEHSDLHEQGSGCYTGCAYAVHTACLHHHGPSQINEEEVEGPMVGHPATPDELIETGGL